VKNGWFLKLYLGSVSAQGKGLKENLFIGEFEKANGINKIEGLQTHPWKEVSCKAVNIFQNHFEYKWKLMSRIFYEGDIL